jgi:hypothetical protein
MYAYKSIVHSVTIRKVFKNSNSSLAQDSTEKKAFFHLNREKKTGMAILTCHPSDGQELKIGRLWSRPA